MSARKEPDFFSRQLCSREAYDALFEPALPHHKAIGEASTSYSMRLRFPHTARQLRDYAPEARLIYSVRHPLLRIESMRSQMVNAGRRLRSSFQDFVREEYVVLVDPSLYHEQLEAYLEHFPREQILIVFFEDFLLAPDEVVRSCYEHIGVDADPVAFPTRSVDRNPREGHLEDRWLTAVVRQSPLSSAWQGVRGRLPPRLSSFVSRALRRRARPQRGDWTGLEWAVERVRRDARLFLAQMGRQSDFWAFPDLAG